MPRPCTFTDQLGGTIARAVEAGLTLTAACGVAGVSRRTVNKWLAEGKRLDRLNPESDAPLAAFARMVQGARAVAACNVINSASKYDWQAAAYMLELLDPDTFGRPKSLTRDLDRLEQRVNALACRMGVVPSAVGA